MPTTCRSLSVEVVCGAPRLSQNWIVRRCLSPVPDSCMQPLTNLYNDVTKPLLMKVSALSQPLRALWEGLLNIGQWPGLSPWERKRVRLLNGIAGIALGVFVGYLVAFAASPDKVTFWFSVVGFCLNIGTLLLNHYRRYEFSAYYTILTVALFYACTAIAKKDDGSEFILITNSIMTVLFFREFYKILVLFLLNVAGFFTVQYAVKVVTPFLYIPQGAYVHDINLLLFILTLFLVVAHFRAENRTQEVQLVQQNEELQQSLAELKNTQDQLVQREKMAFLGELTAGIAHELQNPLNFVKNFAEVSAGLVNDIAVERGGAGRDSGLEQEILAGLKQNLQQISQHGQRASSIIKNMLEHSRTGTSQRVPTNLNALVDESLRLAYQGWQAQDKAFTAKLTTIFDATLVSVPVVPHDMGRVLINLFTNGLHAVRQRQQEAGGVAFVPELTVMTGIESGAVEIRVRDNGTGMSASVRQKVFQPFFSTKPTGEGTGLGLSMSFDIVTKGHGGTLAVSSVEGVGTEFIIRLPQV